MATARSAALIAPGLPMASVPTGMPAGIWTVDRSESMPLRAGLSMGTPSTGRTVWAATTPARWAAPPAAAMMTSMPRASASAVYSVVNAGVRWADMTLDSCGMPNWVSISSAWRMVSQSDLLPMITATRGALASGIRWRPNDAARYAVSQAVSGIIERHGPRAHRHPRDSPGRARRRPPGRACALVTRATRPPDHLRRPAAAGRAAGGLGPRA